MNTVRRGGRLGTYALGVLLALTLVLVLVVSTGLGPSGDDSSTVRPTAASPSTSAPAAAAVPAPAPAPAPTPAPAPGGQVGAARAVAPNGKHVVAISVDGLMPQALARLGRKRTPNLHRLITRGAGTMNARTQVEQTVTLPNHTSMVTGRRISRAFGGHGVTWNDDSRSETVQQAAGTPVSSVFESVEAAGGSAAVFSTKSKFSLWKESWPASVDRSYIRVEDNARVTRAMRADLAANRRDFYFLHLGIADQRGHQFGWMSPRYLDAVKYADKLVGQVLRTITSRSDLARSTVVVLTADHGGRPGTKGHSEATRFENFRVPFAIWGAGVADRDLYALNAGTRLSPGRTQPGFDAAVQPVRNGEVANLSLALLGLPAVPGSLWNARQDLRWR